MEKCVFILGDSCISRNDIIGTLLGAGIVLILLGIYFYSNWKSSNEDGEGIKTISMKFQTTELTSEPQVVVATNTKDSEEHNAKRPPYKVGDKIFAGRNEGLGARLVVLSFDDGRKEINCRMIAQAPVGAKNIRVRFVPDSDYKLGSAEIEYEDADGNGNNVEIGLSDDGIYNSSYTLVVEASKSTFEDIVE